ncbi:MAG TPA: glucan biosynthesis protein G [Steroidobacteraceae bacterium]|nr:glucan biosynthesis protein G [Steroidobacteraceae bacterium]
MPVSLTNSLWVLALATVAMTAHGAGRPRGKPAAPPPAAPPSGADNAAGSYAFSFDTLLEDAKRRAQKPYSPQRSTLPAGLDKLSPEQYRSIHFNPNAGVWRSEQVPFRLELLRTGYNLQSVAVTVSTVEDGMAQDLVATPAMFEISPSLPQLGKKVSLPLSGFRIRSQINSKKIWDEFLVFQGASYFRAVAQHLLYGLSARGLAINTAEPSGEEFPAFTHFWVERPGPRANSVVIYALLESDSATGAYRFTVQPGVETLMDVELTVFPRTDMRVVGIAPLTSMFLFDETNRGRLDDYRPEVHDSDGLMIDSSSGEQIFRQLVNPIKLQVSTFTTQQPKGFGLVQRSRDQSDFQDFENQYERRPSAWIEPKGDWGPGAVELVEIPSGRESNDNIVAFWRPLHGLAANHPAHFEYRITWLAEPALPKGMGKVFATRSGASIDGKRRVFILDFVGAGERIDGLRLDLAASTGRISNATLKSNGSVHGLRASFEIDPNDAELIELRMRVMRGDAPVTETWLYRWTAT